MRLRLKDLGAKYFRSLPRCNLKGLPPLAVFVGKNNAGKSNVVDTLSFLQDALAGVAAAATARQVGVTDLVTKKDQGWHIEIDLVFEVHLADRRATFERVLGFQTEEPVLAALATNLLAEVRFRVMIREDVWSEDIFASAADAEDEWTELASAEWTRQSFTTTSTTFDQSLRDWKPPTRLRIPESTGKTRTSPPGPDRILRELDVNAHMDETTREVREAIRAVLSGIVRLGPTVAPQEPGQPREVTRTDAQARELVQHLFTLHNNDPNVLRTIEETVRSIVPELGPFRTPLRRNIATVGVEDLNEEAVIYTFDELSHGTKRLVSIATALLTAPDGNIVILEEPESNLHPSAQASLSRLLVRQSRRIQVLVTTHSPAFISMIPIDWVFLVSRKKGGYTIVERLDEQRVSEVIEELGVRPSDSLEADAVVLVEGKTDIPVYRILAGRLGIGREVQFVDIGGANNAEYFANAKVLNSRRVRQDVSLILDGDLRRGHTADVRLGKILKQLPMAKDHVLVLSKSELEGYLLDVQAICTAYKEYDVSENAVASLVGDPERRRNQKGIFKAVLEGLNIHDPTEVAAQRIATELGDVPREIADFFNAVAERIRTTP